MRKIKEPTEKQKKEFEKAWEYYWYKIKPVWDRLHDNETKEFIICSKFFISIIQTRGKQEESSIGNG